MNNNNLEKYLESEIEKLKKEIENKKNRHYVNQNIIEECRLRIKDYRNKEDSVFNLLSPISVESSYKGKISEENKIIEDTNNENMILISEIDECKNKIQEIEKQLEIQRNIREAQSVSDDKNGHYSSTEPEQADVENDFGEDWITFINKILEEILEAENVCYSNPKACKDKLSSLRSYIDYMCFGEK